MIWTTASFPPGPNDQEFMENLYQDFKWLMLSTAQKYVSNLHDQEDVMQSAVEKLIAKIPTLRTLEPFALANYITCTVRNTAIDLLRHQGQSRKHFFSMEEGELVQVPEDAHSYSSMEDYITLQDRITQLMEVWRELPEEDQILLERKYILNYKDKELAIEFHCKPASIRMKLTRARRRVLQFLIEKGDVPV